MNFVDILTDEVIAPSMTEESIDKGGGLLIPSSLRHKDDDFAIVEIEENIYVLELDGADALKETDSDLKAKRIASILASAYSDLEIDGQARIFLPFESSLKELIDGALLAREYGARYYIFIGAKEDEFDVCDALLEGKNGICLYGVSKEATNEAISNFCEYDDYIFDVVSARGAAAFEYVERDIGDAPCIIASVKSPMSCATGVLEALGVKAKDEKEAMKKLGELFAV